MAQLDELRRVSRYTKVKAILPAHRVGTMINSIQRAVVLDTVPALPDGNRCRRSEQRLPVDDVTGW